MTTVAGDAYRTIERFWAIQDTGDYTRLAELFDPDAVLEDPIYGRYEGIEAIRGFLERMNTEVAAQGASFRLVELAGEEHTAWARWEVTVESRDRTITRSGVGIYRVRDGRLVYYRDYMDAPPTR